MALKPMMQGFVDRQGRNHAALGAWQAKAEEWGVTGFVCNPPAGTDPTGQDGMSWAYIMDPGTQSAATTAIQSELDWAQANGYTVKIRIFNPPPAAVVNAGGTDANRVKHLGGTLPAGPCLTGQEFTAAGYTIPNVARWWTTAYVDAYFALHAYLAGQFDGHPALRDVAFHAGCLDYAEPMIRRNYAGGTTGPPPLKLDYRKANHDSWVASGSPGGGFSARDKAVLKQMMSAHLAYTTTRCSIASNPWQTIEPSTCFSSGTVWPKLIPGTDINGTIEMLDEWIRVMGAQGTVGNNSLRPNGPGPAALYQQMYEHHRDMVASVYYQTAGDAALKKQIGATNNGEVMADLQAVLEHTVDRAASFGATYIELPGAYKDTTQNLTPIPFPTIRPNVTFTMTPSTGMEPLTVHFDGDGNDPLGLGPLSYQWMIGPEMSSPAADPDFTMDMVAGYYTVVLTATDTRGATNSTENILTVTPKVLTEPTVTISADKVTGPWPLAVNFSAVIDPGSGSIFGYQWDFGDVYSSAVFTPPWPNEAPTLHVYNSPGTYDATLTVNNTDSLSKTSTPVTIIVMPQPPVAHITVLSELEPRAPTTVSFSSATSENTTNVSWDFGDGGFSGLDNPTHIYNNPGDYVVRLTAFNDTGQTDVDQFIMRIRPPEFIPPVFTTQEVNVIDVIRMTVPATETLIWDGGTGLGEANLDHVHSENDRTYVFVFRNTGAGIVYIGPKGKTSSTTGFPVGAAATVNFEAGYADRIYATSASTSAIEVLVGST